MYIFIITNLAQINAAVFGHTGIVVQSHSSPSSFTPHPECLESSLDLYVHKLLLSAYLMKFKTDC